MFQIQGITRGFLQLAFLWLILGETSTIFLNVRWMLYKNGLEKTRFYLVNGIFLVLTFFLFRILLYGAGLLYMFVHLMPVINEADSVFMRYSPYILVAAYTLNIKWFHMLAMKAIQAWHDVPQKKGK